jgi:hypothetical protein
MTSGHRDFLDSLMITLRAKQLQYKPYVIPEALDNNPGLLHQNKSNYNFNALK